MAFIAKHRGYNIKQKIYNSRNYMAFIAYFCLDSQAISESTIVEIIWLL